MPTDPPLTFPGSLHLTPLSPNTFTNTHEPWTWPYSPIIPGGVLMSQSALAASRTIPQGFSVSSLHVHFLASPSAKKPLLYRVAVLSDGGRFAVRNVILEQEGRNMVNTTVSFVKDAPWLGNSMTHGAKRRTEEHVSEITMDDLEDGRGLLGGWMRFQRLPIVSVEDGDVTKGITSSVAQIIPPIRGEEDMVMSHVLGVINLSDYHVMDAPLQLHGITFGLPRIGDKDGPMTERQTKISTSLNHTVHFHRVSGWRADELMYVEVSTCWAKDGRAMIRSEIFDKDGGIVATCEQESFYVFQKWVKL